MEINESELYSQLQSGDYEIFNNLPNNFPMSYTRILQIISNQENSIKLLESFITYHNRNNSHKYKIYDLTAVIINSHIAFIYLLLYSFGSIINKIKFTKKAILYCRHDIVKFMKEYITSDKLLRLIMKYGCDSCIKEYEHELCTENYDIILDKYNLSAFKYYLSKCIPLTTRQLNRISKMVLFDECVKNNTVTVKREKEYNGTISTFEIL